MNVEKLALAWLREHLDATGYTRTDSVLDDYLPAFVVTRPPGGTSADLGQTTAILDVHVLVHTDPTNPTDTGRSDLWALADTTQAAMLALAANGNEYGYVDEVLMRSGFGIVGFGNPNILRAVSTWELHVRN